MGNSGGVFGRWKPRQPGTDRHSDHGDEHHFQQISDVCTTTTPLLIICFRADSHASLGRSIRFVKGGVVMIFYISKTAEEQCSFPELFTLVFDRCHSPIGKLID